MTLSVGVAGLWDAEALGDLAAATFPLACPPGSSAEDIDLFIEQVLSSERFGDYLQDPARTILKATADGEFVGYSMLVRGTPESSDVSSTLSSWPTVEVSKMYVLPGKHGTGVSTALMVAAIDISRAEHAHGMWLGVNELNVKAQKFYAKHGFQRVGRKTFTLGNKTENDYVMERVVSSN